MSVVGNTGKDVFPAYVTKVYPPIPASWYDPKAWGVAQVWISPSGNLQHPGQTFVTKNVQVGDACYICSGEPTGTTVSLVMAEAAIRTAAVPSITINDPVYKVGHDHLHTLQTLAQIVSERAITFYTVHYDQLYTGADLPNWNTDESGDVYVISHDIQKAVWLDGKIKLPYTGPADLLPTPPPRSIDDWPALYPGEPQPDYPAGLEPGGILRAALVSEHGSLLAAYNFYYEA